MNIHPPPPINALVTPLNINGGGVGAYIRDDIPFKRRTDFEQLYPDLEVLWLEVPGRNTNSKLLLGTIYRSERIITNTTMVRHNRISTH
jgi:hypothetical protein